LSVNTPAGKGLQSELAGLNDRVEALERADLDRRKAERALKESEEKFRLLVEHAGDAFFVCEEDGRISSVNEFACKSTGYTREELLGQELWAIAEHANPEAFAYKIRRLSATGEPMTVSGAHRRKDGTRFPVEVRATLFYAAGRRCIQLLVRDISDRVRAEAAIRESEERFRKIFEQSNDAIVLLDPAEDRIVDANRRAASLLGYSQEALLATPISTIHPEMDKLAALAEQVFRDGQGWTDELACETSDGRHVPTEVSASLVELGGRQLILALVRDVTRRLAAQEALRRSEERFRKLVEQAADAFLLLDADLRIVDVNDRACDSLGYGREDLIGMELSRVAAVPDGVVEEIYRKVVPGVPMTVDAIHRRRDGSAFPVEVRVGAFESPTGRHFIGLARDVTERQRAEDALKESQERLAGIVDSAMDAIVTVDTAGTIRLFNPAAEETFGVSAPQVLGTSIDQFVSVDVHRLVSEAIERRGRLRDGQVWLPEGAMGRRLPDEAFAIEGTISRADVGGQPLYTIILRDVDERKRAEARLRKLELATIYLQEEIETERHFGEFVGASELMQRLLEDIRRVCRTDSTVLITGETGTGKELVARAVHRQSERRDSVLVKVNCAALPESLIESELFGHEKGAFTGALTRKIGRFELADGGTIFLDEIGELPPELQTKLLRVLQEGEFERVGGSATLQVDARIIAATNRDLGDAIEAGRFRADLFYRLNVFPIHVPPLRERTVDIPLLVKYFATKYGARTAKRIETIPRHTLTALVEYPWPGNVRELENVVERAVILSQGTELELADWFTRRKRNGIGGPFPSLDEVQRNHILKALEHTGWRVSGSRGAAKLLGVKPTTLEARMKKLGVKREK
jgi:PAS domain S-box-containing protein